MFHGGKKGLPVDGAGLVFRVVPLDDVDVVFGNGAQIVLYRYGCGDVDGADQRIGTALQVVLGGLQPGPLDIDVEKYPDQDDQGQYPGDECRRQAAPQGQVRIGPESHHVLISTVLNFADRTFVVPGIYN